MPELERTGRATKTVLREVWMLFTQLRGVLLVVAGLDLVCALAVEAPQWLMHGIGLVVGATLADVVGTVLTYFGAALATAGVRELLNGAPALSASTWRAAARALPGLIVLALVVRAPIYVTPVETILGVSGDTSNGDAANLGMLSGLVTLTFYYVAPLLVLERSSFLHAAVESPKLLRQSFGTLLRCGILITLPAIFVHQLARSRVSPVIIVLAGLPNAAPFVAGALQSVAAVLFVPGVVLRALVLLKLRHEQAQRTLGATS